MVRAPGFIMNEPDPNKPVRNWISYYSMETPLYNCPTCNTELNIEHPAYNLTKLIEWVSGNWDVFEGYSMGQTVPVTGATLPITVVASKITYDTGDFDRDHFYEWPQGSTFEAYVVFQIGDSFYKKTGTGDSYGDVSWDGELRTVTATERVVKEFK
jgi:hypothetical protein